MEEFVKYYEDNEEEDYETKEILPLEKATEVLVGLIKGSDLTEIDAIDVYFSEIEIEQTKEERDAIIVDFIPVKGRDKVYLIYVKDFDEYMWGEIAEKLKGAIKDLPLNVCDEDELFVSLCKV